jgi:hypothetical protein
MDKNAEFVSVRVKGRGKWIVTQQRAAQFRRKIEALSDHGARRGTMSHKVIQIDGMNPQLRAVPFYHEVSRTNIPIDNLPLMQLSDKSCTVVSDHDAFLKRAFRSLEVFLQRLPIDVV